ncbi:hypothetical protein [Streptomyces sp. NPDC058872]|uniref:hypothetical protein n=1 Tax=Streptomyces sp. NPDC058872 TaxID=3346661 RepID=UPI0036B38148
MLASAIQRELEALAVESIAPGQAALALALAVTIDDATAPTAKAVAARELRALMRELRSLAPVRSDGDQLDELQARRRARRGA